MTKRIDHNTQFVEINFSKNLHGTLNLPASKSSSTRALLTSSVTSGESSIKNIATGFNTLAMKSNCERLGAIFKENGNKLIVNGVDVRSINHPLEINPGNSGVVLRLLMGVAGFLPETKFITDYHSSLGVRSQTEMISALRMLNVQCEASGQEHRLPITIKSNKRLNNYTEVSCRKSSQFLSGLLYLGSIMDNDLTIKVIDDITAKSMVHTTINNLKKAGVKVEYDSDFRKFFISGNSQLQPSDFVVGADPASTAAILSLCSSLESDVQLNGFFEEELGNGAVIQYLIDTGTDITFIKDETIKIRGTTDILPLDFDGSLAPDAVPALAARAAFASGTSIFYNIEHIRYKESDRISDFRKELSKLGVKSDEKQDQLIIHGNPKGYKGGVVLDGHYDHGLIMGLTTIGLHCSEPVVIKEPYHVGQTYPEYFSEISSLGANIK
ncbi:3-phosphoshikimate 1-carboxyvinyltransferase [Xenorhabdus miraniensis]|uniref:3-phosphoshikimate 1-carboxyvinyltransferase n=1 Tax=Xenorhabdus miraniensis TaxID=351674 RepID=A0A2D0JUW2_9GAMM|nr:3-phosphoshikimate 1-carboxyvinyltransferase [Xenorhabdus miraniensis]PHM50106.1 3-phosphoshikimate 1-carboxyvinyltransferase [Xenorhabdus miraniensis]